MTKDFVQIANDVITGAGLLQQGAPDAMKGFAALAKAALAANALDTKTKELMALAIGIAAHCDGCVAYPGARPALSNLPLVRCAEGEWQGMVVELSVTRISSVSQFTIELAGSRGRMLWE